jgi:hypothetical protein
VLGFLYLAARQSMPRRTHARAAIYAALFWSVQGSGVFDPDGFDFRRLSPRWLAVAMFTAIFLGVGWLVAVGVERVIDAWPSRLVALLPLVGLAVAVPVAVLAVLALVVAWVCQRWRWVRRAGSVAVAAPFAIWGAPTAANVIRILV